MKKILVSVVLVLTFFIGYAQQKVNSQFTKTWFADGHIEAMIVYTDGTHYTYPTEWLDGNEKTHRLPHKGDYKHCEWVWRNNQWIETVQQVY